MSSQVRTEPLDSASGATGQDARASAPEEGGPPGDLVAALSRLASGMRSSRTVSAVLERAGSGLRLLGLELFISRLRGDTLEVVYLGLSAAVREGLEGLFGASLEGLRTPLSQLPNTQKALNERGAIWIDAPWSSARASPPARAAAATEPRPLPTLKGVVVPLYVDDAPWGAMFILGARLQPADLAGLGLFGFQLSASLELVQSVEELELHNRRLDAIRQMSLVGQGAPDVGDLARRLCELVQEDLGCLSAALYILEPAVATLRLVGQAGQDPPGLLRELACDDPAVAAVVRAKSSVEDKPGSAVVPLLTDGELIGVLRLERPHGRPLGGDDLEWAEMFAAQSAVNLERARLQAEARRRLEDLSLVDELGRLVAQHLELSAVLSTAMKHMSRIANVPNTFLMLLDEQAEHLQIVASSMNDPSILEIRLPRSENAVAWTAVLERRVVVVEHSSKDARVSPRLVQRFGHEALLGVPLIAGGEPIGAMVLGDRQAGRRFTRGEIDRSAAVANHLATAIAKARLFEDLKHSYDQLARAQEELVKRERLAALGELSAVVAHEVRNPLGVIFNAVASLRRTGPEASRLCLDILEEEAERLNRMVGELLEFARPHEPQLRPVPLKPLVHGAVEAAASAFPARGIVFDIHFAGPSAPVRLDPELLRRALVNLVVNAIQVLGTQGRVQLFVREERRHDKPGVRIEVSDDGPGIPLELRERIFQPFFTTKATGTGLGLAVVRRTVDAHRGELSLEPREGGATFVVWLPV